MKWKRTPTGYESRDGRWRIVRQQELVYRGTYRTRWDLLDGDKVVLEFHESCRDCKEWAADVADNDLKDAA